jgi:hypothetical protein
VSTDDLFRLLVCLVCIIVSLLLVAVVMLGNEIVL